MGVEVVVDKFTPKEWRSLAGAFTDHNLYQTWAFGDRRAAEAGGECSRIAVLRDRHAVGVAQVRIKRIPILGGGIAHVYRGPLWRHAGAELGDLATVVDALVEEYAIRRKLLLRVLPNLFAADQDAVQVFAHAGLKLDESEPPYRTFLLDLSSDLPDLRKRLAQKWRNCLNSAERGGLDVREADDDQAWDEFGKLYDEMWAAKQFETGVSLNTFRAVQSQLHSSERKRVLIAYADGQLAAGHISSLLGDTCVYLLGASGELGRKTKASYLLQWNALEWAKRNGARWYDLGGIDPEKNPSVYHYKLGLGGQDVTFAGQFERTSNGPRRLIVPLAERAYRAFAGKPSAPARSAT